MNTTGLRLSSGCSKSSTILVQNQLDRLRKEEQTTKLPNKKAVVVRHLNSSYTGTGKTSKGEKHRCSHLLWLSCLLLYENNNKATRITKQNKSEAPRTPLWGVSLNEPPRNSKHAKLQENNTFQERMFWRTFTAFNPKRPGQVALRLNSTIKFSGLTEGLGYRTYVLWMFASKV